LTATDAASPRTGKRSKVERALLRYRVMAFATGTALVLACIALLLQKAFGVNHMNVPNAILWVTHGYFFLVYVMTTLYLGIAVRWPLWRIAVVAVAGTVPTMSFVAEHFVTKRLRASHPAP
jgi:integral membrane protein